jgi:hypothetical protein
VSLGKPLGQAEGHRHDVLGHRPGIRPGVVGEDDARRDRGEVDAVHAHGQELDKPQLRGLRELAWRELAAEVPGDQGLGPAQRLGPLGRLLILQKDDVCLVAQDVEVGLAKLVVYRVADGNQGLFHHGPPFMFRIEGRVLGLGPNGR